MKIKNKITLEQAKVEIISFLDAHYVDTDVDEMSESAKDDFEELIRIISKPVMQGRAVVDGDKFILTLRKPQGDLKEVIVNGLDAKAIFSAGKGKNTSQEEKMGYIMAEMLKIPFAQVGRLVAQDFMIVSTLSSVFIAV